VTIAYNPDGTERFTNFKTLIRSVPALKDWKWEDRFNTEKQLVGLLWMMQTLWAKLTFGQSFDRYAFALVSYNSGFGSLLKDRVLCQNSDGCDPNKWYGNVEFHSYKSQIPLVGYGQQSFFSISRDYPKTIQFTRSPKYKQWFTYVPPTARSAP
jgi:hypothetical protein